MEPEIPTRAPKKSRVRIFVAIAVIAAIVATGSLAYDYGYFQSSPPAGGPSLMTATCSSLSNRTSAVQGSASGGSGPHAYFLIVAADPGSPYEGFNGSALHSISTPWPVMHVNKGQIVSIHVINCATSESHGFQIQTYDDNAIITIRPGQSYDVTFTADQTGTFKVYCDIFCVIHPYMQNGELIVS